jgi:HEAT repeat protein
VQREALRALVLAGADLAGHMLVRALTAGSARTRATLTQELKQLRDERAAPLLLYLVRHLDRRTQPEAHRSSLEALGASGGPDAVDALRQALYEGEWWRPLRTRAHRRTVAAGLRRIGTPDALDVLREAAERGAPGVRAAARAQLARMGGERSGQP